MSAWASKAPATPRARSRRSTSSTGPDWYAIFKDFHAGPLSIWRGNKKEAGKRFKRSAYKLEPTAFRIVQAYASWLSRNGSKEEALKVLHETFNKTLSKHPLVVEAMDSIGKSGSCRRIGRQR